MLTVALLGILPAQLPTLRLETAEKSEESDHEETYEEQEKGEKDLVKKNGLI